MAKKDLKYFMVQREEQIVSIPGVESFKDDEGNIINFDVRVLSSKEIRNINDKYRERTIATDKKGQPYISNGEVVFKTKRDNERATRHIMVEALAFPDLKDKALMEFYDCVDITEMPLLVFSKTDEYTQVMRAILQVLGIVEEPDNDDDINAAKN